MATAQQQVPSIYEAFERFQKQCRTLDDIHNDLRKQLDGAQLELERKNRELAGRVREVEEVKEKLSGVLESISDAVIVVNENGEIELANLAADRFFDRSLEGESLAKTEPELADLAKQADSVENFELVIGGENPRTVIVTVSPASENTVLKKSGIISLRDVTEYRKLQERVAREDRLAALGQVAANVAHEIRNPLGAIEGFARLVHSDVQDKMPETGRLTEKIVYAAHQLNCVVSNLLNYARGPRFSFIPQNLYVTVKDMVALVEPMAGDVEVEINIEAEDASISAEIDTVQFKQVLGNLLVNAVEACPVCDGGEITIRLEEKGNMIHLEVQDNGPGVPPEAGDRIFEPFFTLKDGGVGLGLAMCRRIVDGHSGSISVRNINGSGAVFSISLPREQQEHD